MLQKNEKFFTAAFDENNPINDFPLTSNALRSIAFKFAKLLYLKDEFKTKMQKTGYFWSMGFQKEVKTLKSINRKAYLLFAQRNDA